MKHIIEIDGIKIGQDSPPYIIAELSGNHNGDINRAMQLIDAAKAAGAQAVKLQTYTPDSLVLDSNREEFTLNAPKSNWNGKKLYELYEEAHTPRDWHQKLYDHARQIGITIFSSPFDKEAVDFLESLNSPAYKIASNELHDWPLVARICQTGKPIILSTGVATKADVEKTLAFMRKNNADNIVVLHCVSAYPAPIEDMNLNTMLDIADSFDVPVGLSDHSLGTEAPVAAVANGAIMVEKHITLDREDGGPDSSFSLEPDELKTLCDETRAAWENVDNISFNSEIMGNVVYGGETNLKSKGIYTRQFWTIEDVHQGDELSEKNIKSIRAPNDSGAISTMEFESVYGAKAKEAISKHSPLKSSSILPEEEYV